MNDLCWDLFCATGSPVAYLLYRAAQRGAAK